jgi:hypothetical protein
MKVPSNTPNQKKLARQATQALGRQCFLCGRPLRRPVGSCYYSGHARDCPWNPANFAHDFLNSRDVSVKREYVPGPRYRARCLTHGDFTTNLESPICPWCRATHLPDEATILKA